jgi:hypothetical protein
MYGSKETIRWNADSHSPPPPPPLFALFPHSHAVKAAGAVFAFLLPRKNVSKRPLESRASWQWADTAALRKKSTAPSRCSLWPPTPRRRPSQWCWRANFTFSETRVRSPKNQRHEQIIEEQIHTCRPLGRALRRSKWVFKSSALMTRSRKYGIFSSDFQLQGGYLRGSIILPTTERDFTLELSLEYGLEDMDDINPDRVTPCLLYLKGKNTECHWPLHGLLPTGDHVAVPHRVRHKFCNTWFVCHISLNLGLSDLYLVAFDSPYNFASVSILHIFLYSLGIPFT